MEYLRKFNEHHDYSTDENIPLTNDGITTSYCETDFHIHYSYDENNIIHFLNDSSYDDETDDAKFCDILYTNYYGDLLYSSEILSPSLGFIPIGLCIMPYSFTNYNDSVWMSLKYMSYTSPITGLLTQESMYGGYRTYNDRNYLANPYKNSTADNVTIYSPDGPMSSLHLLTSYIEDYEYPENSGHYYVVPGNNSTLNTNILGTRDSYALTDTLGKSNTQTILSYCDNENNTWRNSLQLNNNNSPGTSNNRNYSPSICCCKRYHTIGTQALEWFLPSCGQLAMVVHFKDFINAVLSRIHNVYPIHCINSLDESGKSNCYWTSTECEYNKTWIIDFTNGNISKGTVNTNQYSVIAAFELNRSYYYTNYLRY